MILLGFIIASITVLVAMVCFYSSWQPIWNSRWWKKWDTGLPLDKLVPTHKTLVKSQQYFLFYPPVWLQDLWWATCFIFAGLSPYFLFSDTFPGQYQIDTEIPFLIAFSYVFYLIHMALHGMWAIPFFYWNMPFWSCCYLFFSFTLSVIYIIITGFNSITASLVYIPFSISIFILCIGNFIIWNYFTDIPIGNPIKRYYKRGLNPTKSLYTT